MTTKAAERKAVRGSGKGQSRLLEHQTGVPAMNRIYCCFPGGKHKALTMSYDDGRTQDRRLIEIFNQNGIKGTFHLNSGLFDRGDRILPEESPSL